MSDTKPGWSAARAPKVFLALVAAAFTFPLLASLVNLLKFNDYPIAAREVWPVYLGLAALGVAIGLIYLVAPRLVRPLVEAAFVAFVVDINTEGALGIVVSAVLVLGVSLLWRRPLVAPMAFGGFVLLLLCVVGVGDSATLLASPIRPTSSDRPLLLHIILDEHGGIAGLPAENPQTPHRREALKETYLGLGFRLYGAAYSQHMRTTLAVPQILNFGVSPPVRKDNRGGGLVVRTTYLDQLEQLGYAVRIYQSSWVDLCARDPAVSCVRYQEAGLSALEDAELPLSDKSKVIAIKLIARSGAVHKALALYARYIVPLAAHFGVTLATPSLANHMLTNSLQSLEIADTLIADLAHARPGQAYIAHLLLPHYPYVVRANCEVKPRSEWLYRHFGGTVRTREDAAYEQMLCAARKVREAIAAIERSGAGDNYVVVVHGDHGSRITVHDPHAGAKPRSSDRDLVAGYATLFAIKGAGISPAYVSTPARVDDLLAAFVRSGFTLAPASQTADQEIFLEDSKWRPAERTRLPPNWADDQMIP